MSWLVLWIEMCLPQNMLKYSPLYLRCVLLGDRVFPEVIKLKGRFYLIFLISGPNPVQLVSL